MFNINIFKCKTKKQFDSLLDELSEETKFIYEARDRDVLNTLENDVQKIIYIDWRTGGVISSYNEETKKYERVKRYKHVSEHDWDFANSLIMETICLGLG